MATNPDYPGASSRVDKGKTVWRYKQPRSRKETRLPGQPGDEAFELAYAEASRTKCAAEILNLPGRALPFTFGKAARLLEKAAWWVEYDDKTQLYNSRFIERFLEMQVDPTAPLKWRDVPVAAMTRPYLNDIVMSIYTHTPHTGRHWMTAFRKLIRIAVEEKWIEPENDPSLTIKLKKPAHVGCPAWPHDVRAKFEARHPLGSAARTCYALAMWMGNRRGDIAYLGWDAYIEDEIEDDDGITYEWIFDFNQRKNRKRNGGKEMKIGVTKKLQAVLDALTREDGKTILQRFDGEPYSEKSLTNQMAVWTKQAGLPAGYTLHGLRRTFAHYLQQANVDLLEIRDMLGHDDVRTTQIYLSKIASSKTASKVRGVIDAREDKRDQAQRRSAIYAVK